MTKVPFMLKASAAQAFIALLVFPVALMVISVIFAFLTQMSITTIGYVFPFVAILMYVPLFLWYWNIGTYLHNKLPENLQFHKNIFKIVFALEVIIILVMAFYLLNLFLTEIFLKNTQPDFFSPEFLPMFPLMIVGVLSIFSVAIYNARTIRTLELQEKVTYQDSFEEFQWLMSFPIGLKIIQPRINKLVSDNDE